MPASGLKKPTAQGAQECPCAVQPGGHVHASPCAVQGDSQVERRPRNGVRSSPSARTGSATARSERAQRATQKAIARQSRMPGHGFIVFVLKFLMHVQNSLCSKWRVKINQYMSIRVSPRLAFGGPLCVAVGLWACISYALHMRATTGETQSPVTLAGERRVGRVDLPCLVLTLNASNLDPSTAGCTPFIGRSFSDQELDFVSTEARRKLANPSLLQRASDLTNNASVNIYMNHARMWQLIAEKHQVALVLEEDALIPIGFYMVLEVLLSNLVRDNATNYVLKLHESSTSYSQWREVYDVAGHRVRTCTCRPSRHSASAAAYLIDRAAAQTLLRHAYPASMHVDVYVHEMGCIRQKIRLYGMKPDLVLMSDRPSTHMNWNSWQRSYLLWKEKIENVLYSTC